MMVVTHNITNCTFTNNSGSLLMNNRLDDELILNHILGMKLLDNMQLQVILTLKLLFVDADNNEQIYDYL